LVAAHAVAQLPFAVVAPRQVRDFAKATGKLAKTDALDAGILAQPTVRDSLGQHIGDLQRMIGEIDATVATVIRTSPAWKVKDDLLQSTPEIGPVLSATLQAVVPK
jgi:transposase